MKVYICEKPSQGRDIARVVGANKQARGYLYGEEVAVTWGYGHLLEAAPPEKYDREFKSWQLSTLPILPKDWLMEVKAEGAEQFEVIKELIAKAQSVVIATDADREGEMIGRELLEYCDYRGTVQRLWLSALDEVSIRKALKTMMDGSQTYPLYQSALARLRADWLIGINLTRLFTLIGKRLGVSGLLSVGRVQTPTLKLVVDRDEAIKSFVAKPYFVLRAKCTVGERSFQAYWCPPDEATDEAGRCCNRALAVAAQNVLLRQGEVTVSGITVKTVSEAPPLPFELSELQSVCSAKLKLGAQETLDVAQALYEQHKATTYPRTDCAYLPMSMLIDKAKVFRALVDADNGLTGLIHLLDTSKVSRAWSDEKVEASAHHAIIPTDAKVDLAAMSDIERQVYALIRGRYLAQFAPDYVYDASEILMTCDSETLQANGRRVKKVGWKECVAQIERQTDEVPILPYLKEGQVCPIKDVVLQDKKTTPPAHYTEGTLIAAMKNIARFVTDPRLKDKLSETSGIGTNATRGSIIKGLIDKELLVKKNNQLKATEKGRALIAAVPTEVSDPATTAIWEGVLESIGRGESKVDVFIERQKTWVSEMVAFHKKQRVDIASLPFPKCPACGNPMVRRRGKESYFWGCSEYPECKGVIFDGKDTPQKAPLKTRGLYKKSLKKHYSG